jgi:hypothetical protein
MVKIMKMNNCKKVANKYSGIKNCQSKSNGFISLRINRLLYRLYTDVNSGSPAVFTSVDPLFREAKKHDSNVTRKMVEQFLTTIPVYTQHRRVVRKFKRLKTLASGLHTDWQADLSDMQKLKSENDGYSYFLVCVDNLSRMMFTTICTNI